MIFRPPFAALAAACLTLAACVSGTTPPRTDASLPDPGAAAVPMPPMRLFGPVRAEPPRRSNADMAQDFIDLSFRLESGRPLDGFSRFEGPITIRMTGPVPPTASRDLSQVLARFRHEAGIDIARSASADASITVEFLPRKTLQARAPNAACFVAPRVSSWRDYVHSGRDEQDWTTYLTRERAAIFIPDDVAPQEVRDCLNEELAQALGPLNDLYRLPDSVFNDDNVNTVLTGFDMLMLRATYDHSLSAGMTEGAVAERLPAILARLNPGGERPGAPYPPTPRAFKEAIERALGGRSSEGARRAAANEALQIAEPWGDHRTGFAWLTVGRLSGRNDAAAAFTAFRNASAIFHQRGLPLYSAHADLQLAGFALANGDDAAAIAAADRSLPAATAAQNASLMAGLMMIKAAALEDEGQTAEAARVRLDSLGWARYGMASDADIRRRLLSIAALAARSEKTDP